MLKKHVQNPVVRNILEWLISIVIALAIFLIIDNFVMRSARVQGASMEPSYVHGDRVIINRFIYRFAEPQRGDVIAFPYFLDPGYYYIKRIVGVPHDVIDMVDGFIYLNGQRLDDDFSSYPVFSGSVSFPVYVEPDTFFVLGDNRRISEDSRFVEVGNVYVGDIIGRINFRWFPFTRLGFVD